jgi:IS1 family transposase
MFSMNRLNGSERVTITRCLVDGNSMRATARIAGVARNTIGKLLLELGAACSKFQDSTLRNLSCQRIQVDGCWAFCYCGQKQVTPEIAELQIAGDVWTWAAIDADTKLIPCWTLGKRDAETAESFVSDLASRLADRIQLTSDALRAYLAAVLNAFGEEVDYAQLVKVYQQSDPGGQRLYSPRQCINREQSPIIDNPDSEHISTSYIERANLTMRVGMRRFTRLTSGFSKSVAHHAAAVSLHMMQYNFARTHQTLKTSPAVAAGVADHVWSIEEIVGLLDAK